jgi:hypothetical protein
MKRPIHNLSINQLNLLVAVEVDNLDELLDLNRSERPEVFVDGDGKLRVALTIQGSIFVSLPVTVLDVILQAQEYPGETFADSVMNCIERVK